MFARVRLPQLGRPGNTPFRKEASCVLSCQLLISMQQCGVVSLVYSTNVQALVTALVQF